MAHDTEEVWELAENRSIAVEEQPENAGHGAVTIFVDDLDTVVDGIVARGIEPTKRETYGNGVRKVTFHDPDGKRDRLRRRRAVTSGPVPHPFIRPSVRIDGSMNRQ